MEQKVMTPKDNFTSKRPVEIGIFEIRRHIPILYTFSKICKTNNTNVTIFTTKELFSRLKSYMGEKDRKNYDIILKRDTENIFSFMKRVETICNKTKGTIFYKRFKKIRKRNLKNHLDLVRLFETITEKRFDSNRNY